MKLINTETLEYPLTDEQVRERFPNTSFAESDFPPTPYVAVIPSERPAFNRSTHRVVEASPALVDGVWTQQWDVEPLDPPLLDEHRARMWDRIQSERDRRQSEGGVKVGGMWWKSSDKEIGRYNSIISAAAAAGVPGSYVMRAGWRSMEPGLTRDMTADFARSIILAGLAQFAAIDDAAQAHRVAMEASDNPLAYSFASGWPAIYGG